MTSQIEADIAGAAWRVGQAAEVLAQQIGSYHATFAATLKPKLTKDGNAWCALYGDDLQVGISGWGDTPAKALFAFEIAMCSPTGTHDIISPATAQEETP